MYHYDPQNGNIYFIPTRFTEPITNELYNIIIREARELDMAVVLINRNLKITHKYMHIHFYDDYITCKSSGSLRSLFVRAPINIQYSEYTCLKDLIEKYT